MVQTSKLKISDMALYISNFVGGEFLSKFQAIKSTRQHHFVFYICSLIANGPTLLCIHLLVLSSALVDDGTGAALQSGRQRCSYLDQLIFQFGRSMYACWKAARSNSLKLMAEPPILWWVLKPKLMLMAGGGNDGKLKLWANSSTPAAQHECIVVRGTVINLVSSIGVDWSCYNGPEPARDVGFDPPLLIHLTN